MTISQFVRRGFQAAALLSVAAGLSAGPANAQVKFGLFLPLSGGAAAYGQSAKEAIELYVKLRNASGGVLGQKIELIILDDAGRPEQAVSIVKRLSSDNVVALIGSIPSPVSFAASQAARQAQTAQIIVNSTAQRITTQGNPWVFRSALPDTALAFGLADFIAEKFPDKKKVGFMYVNDDLGKGGFDAFGARAKELGLELVSVEKYAGGDLDFTSQLSRIKNSGAELFVEWSRYVEGALIAKQMRQMGITLPHFAAEGLSHPKYVELAGDAAEGVMYVNHFFVGAAKGNPTAEDMIEKFRAAYKRDPEYTHALAWDAITMAVVTLELAGSAPDRLKFRDALRSVSFDSMRGRFRFDQKGDPAFAPLVTVIRNGKEEDARRR